MTKKKSFITLIPTIKVIKHFYLRHRWRGQNKLDSLSLGRHSILGRYHKHFWGLIYPHFFGKLGHFNTGNIFLIVKRYSLTNEPKKFYEIISWSNIYVLGQESCSFFRYAPRLNFKLSGQAGKVSKWRTVSLILAWSPAMKKKFYQGTHAEREGSVQLTSVY